MTFTHKLLFALLTLLLLAPAPMLHAVANPDALAALKRGVAALDREDPRTARVELMNAIKADPTLAAARVAQARALLMLGNGIAAQDELDRARALGAAPASYRHLAAQAALLTGRYEDAVREAEAPDVLPGSRLFALRIAAQAWQALGKSDESARTFDRALALAPDDAPLWADIGRFRISTGDMAAAHIAAQRAVAIGPNNADALTLRALLVREQYGLVAALPWFERVVAVKPDHVPALIEYAATLLDTGQASLALGVTRRALALAPGLPRAYFIQAVLAARAGRYDLARSLLMRTRGALDGQAATRLLRGVLHLESGNATLAVREFAPLLDSQPLNLRARLLLARAYYEDGQYSEAEKVLFPLVERADAGSYALRLAARIHEALGDAPLVQDFLSRAALPGRGAADVFKGAGSPAETAGAALAAPAQADVNLRHIRALWQAGQPGLALARAQALAAANPGAYAAQITLGDLFAANGRSAQAVLAYQRAADLRFTADAALRIVDARRRAGDAEGAHDVLDLYLRQNPEDVDAARLAATWYLAEGDAARALPILRALAGRLGHRDALLTANLAWALLDTGDAAAALPYAAHAYRLAPANPVTSDVLGWALFQARGPGQGARDLLEKARQLAPGQPLVAYHLGMLHAAQGDKAAARDLLIQASRAPDFPRAQEVRAALAKL